MILIVVFIVLLFLYGLLSRRMEQTVVTAPIIFTAAGILLVVATGGVETPGLEREGLLKLAEVGLVMLLFTDASHVDLKALKESENLPVRLLERRHAADHPAGDRRRQAWCSPACRSGRRASWPPSWRRPMPVWDS